jgi:hypothetical protein
VEGYDSAVSIKVTVKAKKVETTASAISAPAGSSNPPPTEVKPFVLDVVSVSIPNARQMIVNYNGVISGSAVETAANYYINGKAAVHASLSEDGKSVTLTTTSANSMSNYSTNNKLVINKNVGFSTDKTIENLAFIDTAAPTMVSAVATGPRTIQITFSEPIRPALTDTAEKNYCCIHIG